MGVGKSRSEKALESQHWRGKQRSLPRRRYNLEVSTDKTRAARRIDPIVLWGDTAIVDMLMAGIGIA